MLQIPIWQKYQLDNLVKGSFSRLILSYVLYIKMFPNLNMLELDFWQTVFNDCPSHIISSQRGLDKAARISSSSHSSSFIFVRVSDQNFWFFRLKRSLVGESETLRYAIRRHNHTQIITALASATVVFIIIECMSMAFAYEYDHDLKGK